MDVRSENCGRPHQKVRFPAAPVVGRNLLTPGHPGVRVRNVRGKSGPKSLCLCCFSSLKTTWNEYYTNECQSLDSSRSATNTGSTRTKFCVFRGNYDRQRTLVIRIASITLASDSAITLARFRPSKVCTKHRSEEPKRVVSKRVVLADVPPERKPDRGYVRMFPRNKKSERGYVRMFPRNENRNECTFAKTTLLPRLSEPPTKDRVCAK